MVTMMIQWTANSGAGTGGVGHLLYLAFHLLVLIQDSTGGHSQAGASMGDLFQGLE